MDEPSTSSSSIVDVYAQPAKPIELVCLDMDGTLLNSESKITAATVRALREKMRQAGKTIMLATGKARPAAIAACRAAGLAGPGLLVDESGPGIFLQGLAVYDSAGKLMKGRSLTPDVVRLCFEYASDADVSCVAFLGDTCATLKLTSYLRELHTVYYEPLAQEAASIEELVAGPSVKKVLFMADASRISSEVIPHLFDHLEATDTDLTQAVPTMVEVVPGGMSKWVGLQHYLKHTGIHSDSVMAVGDGMNDYELLANVGLSVAMANAVDDVLDIADHVTASNDEDGVAHAINQFLW